MVIGVVVPSNKVPSAKNRQEDEAELHFPLDTDIGTAVSDISIIIVYNGFNHYAATKPLKTTFKDGVKELIALFCSARVLCDKLGQSAADPLVKQVFSKASENSQTAMYSVDKLIQAAHNAPEEQAAAPSKRRRTHSGEGEKKRHARDGSTRWTKTMCKCGVEKHTKEELEYHIERRHADGVYNCPHEGCKMTTKFKSSIEKHVSNQHFNEFYYWCDYCTSYQTDQKNLMENHLGSKHGYGLKIPCTKFGCNKLFSSESSRKEHMKYCQEKKKFFCTYEPCTKSFMREKNLKYHIAVDHTGDKDTISCTDCKNIYKSTTSFKAHKRNNQCYILDEDIEDEEVPEQSEEPME